MSKQSAWDRGLDFGDLPAFAVTADQSGKAAPPSERT